MVAAPGDAPAVARHRVRRALRQARDETDLSQGDVAKRLGWSLSKMQRIEAGEVGVSPTDLRALLDVYGFSDPRQIERLLDDARASRRQRYVTPPEHREHLTPAMVELMQFERVADVINIYQPVFYPGFIQTPAVADAMFDFWRAELDAEERRVRFDVRMERRSRLIESENGPECRLLLDESVIKRRVRNIKITAEQLEDTVELGRLPRIHIRIVPFAKGALAPAIGSFQLLTLAEGDALVYRERFHQDVVTHDPAEVRFHQTVFSELWEQSLGEEATIRAITAEAALLRSQLDREAE